MHRAVLLALLPLAACTTADAGAQAGPAAFEAIAFDINTWGRPLGSWEVHADGTVRHHKAAGSVFGAHKVEHRDFTVDSAAVRRLAAMAAELPHPRPARDACRERATDLPYGSLRLAHGGAEEAVAFDTGCLDAPYRAFVGQLRAMDELVEGWAERHAPTRVEDVGN